MRHAFTAPIFLLVLLPSPVVAQARPDFSGAWTLPADAPLAPNGKPAPAPGFGPSINILHEGNVITVSRVLGGTTVHVRHPLDGTETRSRTPGRLCHGDAQSVWSAAWEQDAIVTTFVGAIPAGATATTPSGVTTTFRLQSPDSLAVELTRRSAGAAQPRTVTTLYRKTGLPAQPPPVETAPLQAGISQAAWLGGTWEGATGRSMAEERWIPPSGGSMMAISRTMRNGHMSAFEFLCIVERNGGLVYQAMPNGRQPATEFVLTNLEGSSLTFENPAHDFPKRIRYNLGADGTLEAVVSGDERDKPLVFTFRRK